MNRQQRRNSQKARKAVLALLVAGALAASGDVSVYADTGTVEGLTLSVTGNIGTGGSEVKFTPPSGMAETFGGTTGSPPVTWSGTFSGTNLAYFAEISSTGTNNASITAPGDLTLTGSVGTLTGSEGSTSQPGGNATLTVSGNLSGKIDLIGGNGASGAAASGRVGGTASLTAKNFTSEEVGVLGGNGGNNGNSSQNTSGGAGGPATVAVTETSNIKTLYMSRGSAGNNIGGSGAVGTGGNASFTTGTYVARLDYELEFYGFSGTDAGSAFNWNTLEFNITSAENTDKLLTVTGDTPFAVNAFPESKITLTGTPHTSLTIGHTIDLISGGIGTGEAPAAWLTAIGTTGFLIEVKEVSGVTSLVATVVPTISYDANDGSGRTVAPEAIATGGTHTTKAANTFGAPTGKVFAGWNTQSDGNGEAYAAGGPVTDVTTNMILYAQWGDAPRRESTTPQTGTESNIAIMGALMAISAVGAICLIFALRRGRRGVRN